ncbi:MAG: hypothetical protein HKO53_11725 [Gemmatimonadetes bacterium]|nr:hypothetical protein [Gemmatimonadota bacterium]
MAAEGTGQHEVQIFVDGQRIADDPKHRASNLRLIQPIDDHHTVEVDVLTLMVGDRGDFGAAELDKLQDKIGGALKLVWMEPRTQKKQEWNGLLVGARGRVDELGAYSVTLRGASPTVKLDCNPRSASYLDTKLSDVVKKICGDAGLDVEVESTGTTYKHIYQHNESSFRFLRRVLAAEGFFFLYDGTTGKAKVARKPKLGTLQLEVQKDLLSFELDAKALPLKSTVTSWDEASAKPLVANVTPPKSSIPLAKKVLDVAKDFYKEVGDRDPEIQGQSLAALEDDCKGLAHTYASRMLLGKGSSARVEVRVGTVIEVSGMSDRFSGNYLVTSVTHTLDDQGYLNHFECTPEDVAGPRRHAAPHEPRLRTGVIAEIQSDDQLGYAAKVKWSHSHGGVADELSDWLRLTAPSAGKDHGWAVMPEIEDEVLVGFEAGDLSHGVILGSLYNGKAKGPAEEIGAELPDNNLKLFKTRSGHKLVFDDTDGSEAIELTTKDGVSSIRMELAGDKVVSITTQGKIEVKAEKAISFESQDSISFKAAKNFEIEAGADINTKSTGKTNLEGAEVNTDAKMKSSLKAGMQVEVKGGSGTVKASPTGVDVQGPLVKLN